MYISAHVLFLLVDIFINLTNVVPMYLFRQKIVKYMIEHLTFLFDNFL